MRAGGVAEQLKDQNNGTLWLDCNAHGLPHRWAPRLRLGHWVGDELVNDPPGWFYCKRCPVTTLTIRTAPASRLGA